MPRTKQLPLFPLSLVAFPEETVNLHIFEPRYRQLFQECEVTGRTFGIVPVSDGKLLDIGTEMRLDHIAKRYEDGKMDVSSQALGTFRLVDYYEEMQDKMYPGGEVEAISWDVAGDPIAMIQIVDLLRSLYDHMDITNVKVPSVEGFDLATVIHKIGLTIEQEVVVLRMTTAMEQQRYVLDHLKVFVPHVVRMEELRRKAALNGHFKHIIPPEF
jgi:hypothetical protein